MQPVSLNTNPLSNSMMESHLAKAKAMGAMADPVSDTHLTLPTILLV